MMKNAPQVGISTVWWEGNPCKYVVPYLLRLGCGSPKADLLTCDIIVLIVSLFRIVICGQLND